MSSYSEIYIYVDDIREDYSDVHVPNGMDFTHARTARGAIAALKEAISHKSKIIVDLDHDLGSGWSGYDVAKWIVEKGYPDIKFHIHSANPVGVANTRQLLTHYGYEEI